MKIGMIFPGYGTQFVGMGKELYDEHRIMQEYFEEAYNCLNVNFIKLCFASSDKELSKITNAYTSIFLTSSSLAALLKEHGIKPDLVAGYGVGHYSAAHAAGGLTFPDGLYLLKKFATYFEEALANMDVGILKVDNVPTAKLKKICESFKDLQICAYNNELENLVSGNSEQIDALKLQLKELKIKSQLIDPAFGLNSDLMKDVADQFKLYFEKVDFKDTGIPIVNCVDAKEINSGKKIEENIIKQISLPIKWNKVIDKFVDMDLIVIVGPGNEFFDYLKEKYPDKKIVAFNNKADLQEVKQLIATCESMQEIKEEYVV